jgi:hypothetical protein
MLFVYKKIKSWGAAIIALLFVLTSCNKDVQQFPVTPPTPASGISLGETLKATADDSLYYRMIIRGGMLTTINNLSATYTMFVPGNAAVRQFVNVASGGAIPVAAPDAVHSGFISTTLPAASAAGIVGYNIIPQKVLAANIPTTFPNIQYPSIVNPAPTISAFLRLTTFPSRRSNGAWVNNIPLSSTDMLAANGVIHHTAAVVTPPSQYLWDRINTDPNFLLLKTAIQRADADPTAPGFLQGALLNIGANLTLFAPDSTAMKNALSFLSGGAIPPSSPSSTFVGFINSLPIANVKGIVVYHILGTRAFSVNFPTTSTFVPTLLNSAVPTHPGVALNATFVSIPGFGMVTATTTVKGAANPTASNITSKDNHFLNGVIHVTDQALLPQ